MSVSTASEPRAGGLDVAPVFVVGVPRSGTTLLASMLAAHPRLSCGPETQFFNKFSQRELRRCVEDPAWPRRAVARLRRLSLADQSVLDLYGVSPELAAARLAARPPSVRAMLEVLVAPQGERPDQPRWVEKTPDHLRHLARIHAAYPDARFVHIVRDPRDVAHSMTVLPWASDAPLANAWVWRSWLEAMERQAEAVGAAVHTVRYERLVGDPDRELRKVCGFIGETFSAAMLNYAGSAGSVRSANEPWKARNSDALAGDRASAWKQAGADDDLTAAISVLCAAGISRYGYEETAAPLSAGVRVPRLDMSFVELLEPELVSALRTGVGLEERDPRRTARGLADLARRARGRIIRERPRLARRLFGHRVRSALASAARREPRRRGSEARS